MGAGICPICERPGPLVRHHLLPRAAGGTDGRRNILKICDGCHRLVHAHFGDGNKFTGPTQKKALVREMRTPRRRAAPQQKRRTRRGERRVPKEYIVLTRADNGLPDWVMIRNIQSWGPCRLPSLGPTYLALVGDRDEPWVFRESPEEIARLIDEARGA